MRRWLVNKLLDLAGWVNAFSFRTEDPKLYWEGTNILRPTTKTYTDWVVPRCV